MSEKLYISQIISGQKIDLIIRPISKSPLFGHFSYRHALVPVLTGVVAAAFFAFCYTLYFNIRTARNDILKDFYSDLDEIERLAAEYWLSNHSSENFHDKNKLDIVGFKLRAKFNASMEYRDLHLSMFNRCAQNKYRELDIKLFINATGGNFQTKNMQASPETYNEIVNIIYQMKTLIRSRRIRKSL
jgi:hypothetical protein